MSPWRLEAGEPGSQEAPGGGAPPAAPPPDLGPKGSPLTVCSEDSHHAPRSWWETRDADEGHDLKDTATQVYTLPP